MHLRTHRVQATVSRGLMLLATFGCWALAGLLLMGAGEPGRFGKSLEPPATKAVPQASNYLLTGEPTVRGGENGVFLLEFETAVPAPAVRMYYGSFLPDQAVEMARYRQFALEKSDVPTTRHSIEVDVARLESPVVDAARLGENQGGAVSYRLEIFWTATQQGSPRNTSVFFDGRFGYRREGKAGDREGAVYTRVPCVVEGPFVDRVTTTSLVISWRSDLPSGGKVLIGRRVVESPTVGVWHEVNVEGLQPGSEYTYAVVAGYGRSTREFHVRTQAERESEFAFAFMSDSREGVGGGEAAMGGVNQQVIRDLSLDAYRRGARFYLFGGDLVNGYTTSEDDIRLQMRAWKSAWAPVGNHRPIYECPGNHEALLDIFEAPKTGLGPDGTGGLTGRVSMNKRDGLPDPYIPGRIAKSVETVFAEEFVNPENGPARGESSLGPGAPPYRENVYWFDWGNTRIIAVNNNYAYCSAPEDFGGNLEGYVMDEALAWFAEVLDAAANDRAIRHVIVFGQEPVYPNGGHLDDAMWYSGGEASRTGFDRSYVIKRRNEFWRLIASNPKCVAFLAGDEHNYSRTLISRDTPVNPDASAEPFEFPVWHLTSGGCGAPYYAQQDAPWSRDVYKFSAQQHYLLFHVRDDRVILDVIGLNGLPIEQVELR